MARPNPLADPEFAKEVAEMFAAGASRQDMCDALGVKDRDTITRWRRDPRVKAIALKIIEDRVLQVTRKVDGVIAERLEHANEMTIQELIMIRKEFLGGALRAQTEKADEQAPHDGQKVVLDSKARFRVMNCGRRWGKTVLAAKIIVSKSRKKNQMLWWVAPTYRSSSVATPRCCKQLPDGVLAKHAPPPSNFDAGRPSSCASRTAPRWSSTPPSARRACWVPPSTSA
jgi:hypothetical protein